MTLVFCAGALFLRGSEVFFPVVAGRRARDILPRFTSGSDSPASAGACFLFWTILLFFGTDWSVLMIPIRLLRIVRFASSFSHVFSEVIEYKNFRG